MLTRRQLMRRLLALGFSAPTVAALLEVACTPGSAVAPTARPEATAVPSPTVSAAGSSAAGSTAGSTPVAVPGPVASRTALPTAAATQAPVPMMAVAPSATPAPAGAAYLAVARGEDPAELTRRVVKAVGGIERFVKPGQSVVVKPNICVAYHGPEYAATTNPQVVAALVTMCREAGAALVTVMDYPFGGTAEQAYKVSQIGDAVRAAGGQMAVMSSVKFRDAEIPDGRDIKKWPAFQDALKADVIIDVPIAKHHNLARLTLGMKNLMGLIERRESIHTNLGDRVVDLVTLFRPRLVVVDAYRMLMANGPTGGRLSDVKPMKTVIASHDIVAADAFATTLFGLKPEQIAYVKAGAARGLGTMDLGKIKIEEIAV